jgi:hypothetical protein
MYMLLSNDKTLNEIQQSFTGKYPFLKLEFYKPNGDSPASIVKKHLPHSMSLRAAGLKQDGLVDINNNMTVSELEKILSQQFGLRAQVSRKSGIVWLETTMTDKWSLQKQNEHGRELTISALKTKWNDRDQEVA